jgi:uncharacterized 2Fe-2S/4Fe-4S cluster protein (DUF4445 family)
MPDVTLHIDTDHGPLEAPAREGQTVLEVIQKQGLPFSAPCGGKGTCGKCGVLLRDGDGLGYRLACRTQVVAGMTVELGATETMLIEESGTAVGLPHDGSSTGLGIAVDIGTTTLACRLFDRATGTALKTAARINPQVVFGADVISRIDVSRAGGLQDLHDALWRALDGLFVRLCTEAGVSTDDISSVVLAGNTVMEHIAAGLAPDSIGVAPYAPLSLFGEERALPGCPSPVYLAPCIAGYVGGDISCGMLATGIDSALEPVLFIDLGTNGEIALGSRDGIHCCATAAGPVFEGANILFGMPALTGAVSAVQDGDTHFTLEVIGGGRPIGICGTGLVDLVAFLFRHGIIDETGKLSPAAEVSPAFASNIGNEDGKAVFYLTDDRDVYLTQGDIRNLQLGKAAIAAGIEVLLEKSGIAPDDIRNLYLAGGFGRRLNLFSAATIGLIPKKLLGKARSVGNTSIEGASAALLSQEARDRLHGIAALSDYAELSTDPTFNAHFMDALAF